jgi:ferredoxin
MGMKLYVDNEKCIGCGICDELLPEFFEMKEGKVFVKKPDFDETEAEALLGAEEDCPGSAISTCADE